MTNKEQAMARGTTGILSLWLRMTSKEQATAKATREILSEAQNDDSWGSDRGTS
jgi:hypothetical protein